MNIPPQKRADVNWHLDHVDRKLSDIKAGGCLATNSTVEELVNSLSDLKNAIVELMSE